MDAKELFEELKAKADELHKYLEAHSEEANMIPSWTFSFLKGDFLLQGCSNIQHETELCFQITKKLHETNIVAFMLVAFKMADMVQKERDEIATMEKQWIN